MSNTNPKQIIIIRKDLNMRRGKQIAQGCHASMKVLLDMCKTSQYMGVDNIEYVKYHFNIVYQEAIHQWLSGSFTKICVSVDSEAELLDVYQKAVEAKLPCALITDNGTTEFNGVPTKTCCAIGPWNREAIDLITGHLKLL